VYLGMGVGRLADGVQTSNAERADPRVGAVALVHSLFAA
jgi:hypothetical protein